MTPERAAAPARQHFHLGAHEVKVLVVGLDVVFLVRCTPANAPFFSTWGAFALAMFPARVSAPAFAVEELPAARAPAAPRAPPRAGGASAPSSGSARSRDAPAARVRGRG